VRRGEATNFGSYAVNNVEDGQLQSDDARHRNPVRSRHIDAVIVPVRPVGDQALEFQLSEPALVDAADNLMVVLSMTMPREDV
jgi:hypothetical protein